MRYLLKIFLLSFSFIALVGCGGVVEEPQATPSPVNAVPSRVPTSSAPTCQGSDPAIAKGQPDSFDEGKNAAAITKTDGLKIVDLKNGTGSVVKTGQCVTAHYSLFLADGTPIESSRSASGSGAFKFAPGTGSVIKGWDEGVPGMKVGGRRRLTIPPALAYGPQAQGKIPANSILVFIIEVYKVQ
jgi:FKBP-type peptidyl-prolyl cis-trans isomerase